MIYILYRMWSCKPKTFWVVYSFVLHGHKKLPWLALLKIIGSTSCFFYSFIYYYVIEKLYVDGLKNGYWILDPFNYTCAIVNFYKKQRLVWPGSQSVTFDTVSRCRFENKNNNCYETKSCKNVTCTAWGKRRLLRLLRPCAPCASCLILIYYGIIFIKN